MSEIVDCWTIQNLDQGNAQKCVNMEIEKRAFQEHVCHLQIVQVKI